jgi:hypothetical protein
MRLSAVLSLLALLVLKALALLDKLVSLHAKRSVRNESAQFTCATSTKPFKHTDTWMRGPLWETQSESERVVVLLERQDGLEACMQLSILASLVKTYKYRRCMRGRARARARAGAGAGEGGGS